MLICHLYIFFHGVPVEIICPLKKIRLSSHFWIVTVLYIAWIKVFCQIYIMKMLFPNLWHNYYFLNNIFWRASLIKFNIRCFYFILHVLSVLLKISFANLMSLRHFPLFQMFCSFPLQLSVFHVSYIVYTVMSCSWFFKIWLSNCASRMSWKCILSPN